MPLIVIKSDGGYNYDSTDVAAMTYRIREMEANRVIILTDLGQKSHFQLIEGACKMAGILDPKIHKFDHMGFGVVLDEEGKRIKSRSGDTVKLMTLLDTAAEEAIQLCKKKDEENKVELTEEEYLKKGEVIGVTSVKYYELKQNRTSDYKFSFKKVLDPNGDSGVYLLYMYARLCSILKKGGYDEDRLAEISKEVEISLDTPEELNLALLILRLPEYVDNVFNDLQVNKICNMLYDISTQIGSFYANNKVLGDPKETSRILLIELARKSMKTLFNLLGMETLDRI